VTRNQTPRLSLTTALSLLVALAVALVSFAAVAEAKPKDRNGNRIPDRWERKNGLSTKRDLSRRDNDRDGLNNRSEYRSGTKPRKVDSDADGLEDADEDRDGDRVDNGNEQRQRTLQNDRDSDNDRRSDGREDRDRDGLLNAGEDSSANDPIDDDSDDDGIEDGDENSGVVASFDGTTLVIDRDIGGQASGTVDGTTRVTCEDEDGHEDLHEQGDSEGRSATLRSGDEEDGEDGGESEDGEDPGSGGDEDGYEDGEDGDAEQHDDGACPTDLLIPGARVHEAELSPAGVFVEIEIVAPDDGDTDVEESVGRITGVAGDNVTILRASTGTEATLPLRSDARIRCKSIYGGESVSCERSEIEPGVLVHEFELEGGAIEKLVLLK